MKKILLMAVIFGIFQLSIHPASARTGVTASLYYSYDSNAFHNYLGMSDNIGKGTIYFNHDINREDEIFRVYYQGNYYQFKNYRDRNFLYHEFGFAYARSISEQNAYLYSGIKFSNRSNKELYNYYDYNQFLAYINIKSPWLGNHIQGGYRLRERTYKNLAGFSYWEHYLFLRFNRAFKTKTSLTIESSYGYKNYLARTFVTTLYDSTFMGGRSGRMGGRGVRTIVSVEDVPSAKLWTNSIRVGQSLTSTTGLSVQVLYRYNFDSEARYLTAVQSGYTTEDELFDDPYSYKGLEYSAQITQLLPRGIQLTAAFTRSHKFYPGHLALDLDGNPTNGQDYRDDKLDYFYFGLEKSFAIGKIVKSTTFFSDYYWINNQSNDAYYKYKSQLFMTGFSFNF
ncbi:MAG: hypothetical protein GXO76_15550 [Calditrichaeota bacterium]|nr:hypothetical protein [Calditrichota bacterium]